MNENPKILYFPVNSTEPNLYQKKKSVVLESFTMRNKNGIREYCLRSLGDSQIMHIMKQLNLIPASWITHTQLTRIIDRYNMQDKK